MSYLIAANARHTREAFTVYGVPDGSRSTYAAFLDENPHRAVLAQIVAGVKHREGQSGGVVGPTPPECIPRGSIGGRGEVG